jgi:hypothetical protein
VSEPARHLRLVDSETGEFTEYGCERCKAVEVGDVEALKDEITRLSRKITAMQRDKEQERRDDPDRILIVELFNLWREVAGHPKSMLGGDRFDAIKSALKLCRREHGEERGNEIVRLAIEGIGAHPYVVNGQRVPKGTPAQRHDRIGIALDGSENIERFANLGHRARKARAA